MGLIIYIANYFFWHYTRGIKDLVLIWTNFVWFTFNYFSITLLLQTLFSPWKRLGEEKKGFFDFTFLVIDLFMRVFGALIRTATIIVGVLVVFLVIISGFFALSAWVLWPAIVIFLFIKGTDLLI